MNKLVVFIMAGLLSGTASAVNWVKFAGNNDVSMYIDTDSIVKNTYTSTAFIRSKFRKVQPATRLEPAYDESMTLSSIQCYQNPKTLKILSIVTSHKGKVVLNRQTNYLDNSTTYIYPGTPGELIANIVC